MAAGCHDELTALQPLDQQEMDCLSVLVLTNDPSRAATVGHGSALGRVDAIGMRIRMLGQELSRLWQFRRMFQAMLSREHLD